MKDYIDEQEYLELIDDTEYYEKQIKELQEENEKLNKIANEFQNRIGKALYYIEHTTFYCSRMNGKTLFNEYLKSIRNVLKGEDNEN